MTQINSLLADLKVQAVSQNFGDLLTRLEKTGLFRALVIETRGKQVLLDTSFGRLSGNTEHKLYKGDEILARITKTSKQPSIKVEQHFPNTVSIPAKHIPASLLNQASPTFAKVVSQASQTTQLQIAQHSLKIPKQPNLQPGESLFIQPAKHQQLDLLRIQPQKLLKQALTILLPQSNNKESSSLSTLNSLAKNVLSAKAQTMLPPTTIQSGKHSSESLPSPAPAQAQVSKPTSAAATSVTTATAHEAKPAANVAAAQINKISNEAAVLKTVVMSGKSTPATNHSIPQVPVESKITPDPALNKDIQTLKTLLQNLAAPLAKIDGVKAESIIKTFQLLSLVKTTTTSPASSASIQTPSVSTPPVATPSIATPSIATPSIATTSVLTTMGTYQNLNIPQTLKALAVVLRNKPEVFDRLTQEILQRAAVSQAGNKQEAQHQDFSTPIRQELLQQTEQTLNQLLTQKTSVRLQTEQNQPIQFNLNIPVEVDNETQSLKLSIKQKNKPDSEQENQWEMNLEFEFGLLGMISTHILLLDNKLSAHFFTTRTETKSLIDLHLGDFKSRLKQQGFEPGLFDCSIGIPKSTSSDEGLNLGENLLDIKV